MSERASIELPDGHPLPWDQLVPYEQQQRGYWLYPPGCDEYGNGKVWVPVRKPWPTDRDEANELFAGRFSRANAAVDEAQRKLRAVQAEFDEYRTWRATHKEETSNA